MGHPLGATGAMILGTALDELERTDKETALATLCVASRHGRRDDHRAGLMPATARAPISGKARPQAFIRP